jgi:hypothetical protein
MTYTESDFDRLSWHDCHIWAVEFRLGDPDTEDWTSDLALDIDFIVEWMCGVGGRGQFRVVPATLVFHGVTDPKIDIEWGRSGVQAALHPVSIGKLERERIQDQKVYLDRPYYRWRLCLNWPDGVKSYSCWKTRRGCTLAWNTNQASPVAAGGKRRHPRAHESTGIGADKPEAG